MKRGDRVVKVMSGPGDFVPDNSLGTIEAVLTPDLCSVAFDGREHYVVCHASQLLPHQEAKRVFKHGPKLRKSKMRV